MQGRNRTYRARPAQGLLDALEAGAAWGGPRRGRGRRAEERPTAEQRQRIAAWFAGRVPADWFTEPAQVTADADEILVVGSLAPVELPEGTTDEDRHTAARARIGGFREDSRDQRVRIAAEAEEQFGRTVSWGARCGDQLEMFTTASVPVMTRLRMPERHVLDTLIDAGVARSRSEALAWCVRLVATNEEVWITDLRRAFEHVEEVRSRGPGAGG
jgi:hypothetical protein